MKNIILLLLISCLTLAVGCSGKKETPPADSARTEPVSPPPDADNTARNAQTNPDALAATNTPLDQGETEADLKITSSIRKSIVNDKSLSTNAHNIKIMTAGGKVTLRGPVKSEQEKSKIEGYAKVATGVAQVDNMLEVEKNP